jgi:uncharacterized membrane protein YphA (DoxX/SURF4 family)
MGLVRRLGQVCLGAVFVGAAADVLRDPGPRAVKAAPLGLAKRLGTDDVTLVRANAAAMVVGGLAVAADVLPRTAALGLAASLAPTTLAGHPFWTETDKAQRKAQQVHFLKNVGLIGGCLILAATPRR